MPPNPLVSESRDEMVSVNLDGVCTKLRVPSSLRFLFSDCKPMHLSTGDSIIKDRLDATLIAHIIAGRYLFVQDTLDALFGPRGNKAEREVTVVTIGNRRSQGGAGGGR